MLGVINQALCEMLAERGQICTARGGDAPPCGRGGFQAFEEYPDAATHQLFLMTHTASGHGEDELARCLGERVAARICAEPHLRSVVQSLGTTFGQALGNLERLLVAGPRAFAGMHHIPDIHLAHLDGSSARLLFRHRGVFPGASPTAVMEGFLVGLGREKGTTVRVSPGGPMSPSDPRFILDLSW